MSKKQIIDIRQSFRVVVNGTVIHESDDLNEALNEAVAAEGDPDVQQAIEFSVFGKKPDTKWLSVFDMNALEEN